MFFLLHKKMACVNNGRVVLCHHKKNYIIKYYKGREIPMMNHPVMKMVCMVTWPITALVSINVLTGAYGYDGLAWLVNMMPGMELPLIWIIGLSGIISLVSFIKAVVMCCPACGSCPCTCNSHMNNNMHKM